MFGIFNSIANQVSNLVREGVVSAIYPERHSARVMFEDRNNLVGAEMPVLTLFAYKNKAYGLPEVGERVVVLSASNDTFAGGGYIIGSLFTSSTPPPVEGNADVTRLEFSDKAFISYDRQTHSFTLQFSDEASITHDGETGELSINCKGNVIINGEKRLEITAKEEIDVESKADINMNGANIRLN